MNKLIIANILVALCATIFAKPAPTPIFAPHHPIHRHQQCPPPIPRHHSHHQHHDNWWIGPTIVGSVILGSAVINATAPKPTIVQPVIMQQPIVTTPVVKQPVQVWIPTHYENRVQANGTIVQVLVPGHYEWR